MHPGLHEGVDVRSDVLRTDDFLRTKISWMHSLPNNKNYGNDSDNSNDTDKDNDCDNNNDNNNDDDNDNAND